MNTQPAIPDLPLRDIHLPEPIGWWPPAPGWWLLTVIVLVICFIAARWLIRRYQGYAVYRSATRALSDVRSEYQSHQDAKRLVEDLSSLLRRVAITVTTRDTAAGLTGLKWLEYLDRMIGQAHFNTDKGRILIEAPYKPSVDISADEILRLCETWVTEVSKPGHKIAFNQFHEVSHA